MTFPDFFKTATGNPPYDYQNRLAMAPSASRLINIPTGLGKTAAVVLAWLWNRVAQPDTVARNTWPRRLVYCLPMRTLVEQTAGEAEKWIKELSRKSLLPGKAPKVIILMGGEETTPEDKDWDLYPEDNTIIIGTQDMLLSRALNRGYGMSRYRWPMHFGLLNNDCLWVMDETQLMGSALWTTSQLDWMRQDRFPSFKHCFSWWMSATLGTSFFDTLDRDQSNIAAPAPVSLSYDEEATIHALKAVRPVCSYSFKPPAAKKSKVKSVEADPTKVFIENLAKAILEQHPGRHLSLVVCNRVRYAQEIRAAIQTHSLPQGPEVLLLTARFRRQDRQDTLKKVVAFEEARKAGIPHPGLILVSTQVIEAGFDISAARLWTETAPWPSFLQRLGRLNRDAKLNMLPAKAYVFQVPAKKDDTGPYDPKDLTAGAQIVAKLEALCCNKPDAPIRQLLAQLESQPEAGKMIRQALEPKQEPFPRAVEVHGLFSTEPDVFGGFTDISPWVRNTDANADASVFWRSFKPTDREANGGDGPGLQATELCSVPITRLRELLGTSRRAWIWEPKKHRWETLRPTDMRPGMTVMLPSGHGGYDVSLGWTGQTSSKLENLPPPGPFEDDDDDDSETQIGQWIALDTHLTDTRQVAEQIAKALELPPTLKACLIRSAELHDIGKSLQRWQSALPAPHPQAASLYAKAPWELVLDLTQAPNAADQCLKLIQSAPKQTILHSRSVSGADPASQHLHLQVKLRLKRSVMDELQIMLKVRPKFSAFRPKCRHEAASALAMWSRYYHGTESSEFPALAIYIVAAHHGKVRSALNSNPRVPGPNVCGIPDEASQILAWNSSWKLDFEAAVDGASGQFNDDGTFSFSAPGWTGLVADLLGGWEKEAPKRTCGAVPEHEPHSLGPFGLAYFEMLLRAADGRSSAAPSQELTHAPS